LYSIGLFEFDLAFKYGILTIAIVVVVVVVISAGSICRQDQLPILIAIIPHALFDSQFIEK
jgi:hypothetical protein